MVVKWETEEERLRKHMKIPPKKKLEWLAQMHELAVKTSSKRGRMVRLKMRGIREGL